MSRIEKILRAMIDNSSYDKEPQSRIEEILLAIKNNSSYDKEPQSRIEEILLAIKNNSSYDKEPQSRIEEILIAKLKELEYTKLPQSRIEELLIEWLIETADKEFEGVPPLTFKSNGKALKNYRIYGNTVGGESVGDRTGNLFDENGVVTNTYIKDDGTTGTGANGDKFICNRINVLPNTTYTFSWGKIVSGTDNNKPYIRVAQYDSNGNFLSRILISIHESLNNRYTVTVDNAVSLWDIRIDDASSKRGQHLEEVMLNEGSTPLPYDPYGYKVPVTVSNGTDTLTIPIYLPKQIRKVGNEVEYIDYAEQKQYFADGSYANVTLPEIPTIAGTNILSVGTEVQPSKVYVKYKGG